MKQTRVLLDLYQNAIERYEQKKIDGAYLDFDDLQFRARNLLQREDIRKKLSQRFKFIMVDEYQDTNVLQYEILLAAGERIKELTTHSSPINYAGSPAAF